MEGTQQAFVFLFRLMWKWQRAAEQDNSESVHEIKFENSISPDLRCSGSGRARHERRAAVQANTLQRKLIPCSAR